MKPILDLFCGAGGAAEGYRRAGFEVVGVDIELQPDYPGTFIGTDAFDFLRNCNILDYSAVHASPPCQRFSAGTKRTPGAKDKHPDLLTPMRAELQKIPIPYVIENVPGAPMRIDLLLCGAMFDLKVIRHRWFEVEGYRFRVPQPLHPPHKGMVRGHNNGLIRDGEYEQVYGSGANADIENWRRAMGIEHTFDKRGLGQAIPPAYTQYIGNALQLTLNGESW